MADLALGKASVSVRARRRERRWVRPALIALGPLLLLAIALYIYVSGGRYVSTDDAYVRADNVQISADVAGRVVEVPVRENEPVKAGEVLVRLDDAPFRYAVDRAAAQLDSVRLEVEAMRATYAQRQADLASAQSMLDYQSREFERQKQLLATRVTSQQLYDQAQHNLDAARQGVDAMRQALATALANLAGDPKIPADKHPRVVAAKAQLDQAKLDLAHTTILAPRDGTVAQVDKLHAGEYVTAGAPLFSLIGKDIWVEANFKETDLTYMKPGQQAQIEIDAYPDAVCIGRVAGISPGAGSEFSVLPPQNASGNWVKIVQRLPVRVQPADCPEAASLRSGMSVTVEVDTKHQRHLAAMIRSAFAGGARRGGE
jgi:membrane fusion protein, multidrug efflux system